MATSEVELREDAFHVVLDGVLADREARRDLGVGEAPASGQYSRWGTVTEVRSCRGTATIGSIKGLERHADA